MVASWRVQGEPIAWAPGIAAQGKDSGRTGVTVEPARRALNPEQLLFGAARKIKAVLSILRRHSDIMLHLNDVGPHGKHHRMSAPRQQPSLVKSNTPKGQPVEVH